MSGRLWRSPQAYPKQRERRNLTRSQGRGLISYMEGKKQKVRDVDEATTRFKR